jgi:hypothetical protein
MNKNTKEFYSTETALVAREKAVLSSLKTEYGQSDLGPNDTERHLLGSIKGCLKKNEEFRLKRICKVDLLEKIHKRLCLYGVLKPGFYRGPLLSVEDLKKARAALREPNAPVRKQQTQALVPARLPKTADVQDLRLPVANEGSSSVHVNELLRSLAAQVTSGQAHVIVIVLNRGIPE